MWPRVVGVVICCIAFAFSVIVSNFYGCRWMPTTAPEAIMNLIGIVLVCTGIIVGIIGGCLADLVGKN